MSRELPEPLVPWTLDERTAAAVRAEPGSWLREDMTDILRGLEGTASLLANGPARLKLQVLGICELLRERSREAWFTDPAKAVEFAELAVLLADRLDEEHYGAGMVAEERARAWAYLGNALRITSDLRRAEEALQTSEEVYGRSGDDAFTEAEIRSFKASLRNAQGRFEEAVDLLDPLIEVCHDSRDSQGEGRALIKKAMSLSYAGRQAEALRAIRRGMKKIDPEKEPALTVAAHHNLIGYLNELGRHEEALAELEAARKLFEELGQGTQLIRLRWLEGRIFLGLGSLEAAEHALLDARQGFVARRRGLGVAFVALDLAILYLRQGKHQEIKQLVAEMVPIFESRDVRQEALAAFLLFRRAAETEKLTLGLIRELAGSLERLGRGAEGW